MLLLDPLSSFVKLRFPSLVASASAVAICLSLAGCSSPSPKSRPPVEDRGLSSSRHAHPSDTTATTSSPGAVESAPASRPTAPVETARPGFYTVKPGDTLIRIGLDTGQNWRDIAKWNNLDNPNLIDVGQSLRVVPPQSEQATVARSGSSGRSESARSSVTSPTVVAGARSGSGANTSAASSASAISPNTSSASSSSTTIASGSAGNDMGGSSGAVVASPVPSQAEPTPIATQRPVPATTAVAAAPAAAPAPALGVAAAKDDDGGLSWIWPAAGSVIANFEEGKTKGVAIAGKAGDPVLAAADGRVVYAGSGLRGYGNLVILKHNSTFLTAYAHNNALLVKEDQSVRRGQKIAEMGATDAERVQLHFEIRRQGKPVDPLKLLPSR